MGLHSTGSVASAVALLMVLAGCGGSSPPEGPSSDTPSANPGTTTVYGTESLNWLQPGDVSHLVFLAYVDGNPVALDDAKCNLATAEAECSSPLPSMTDGMHTIAIAARNPVTGLEGEQSASITVQKVSTRSVVGALSVPEIRVPSGESRIEPAPTTASGDNSFSIDVVARGLRGPVQLASTPDGRLLIAEGDARVRVVRPGELERLDRALDARLLLQPTPAGGLGLAVHPDFARNHFVYISSLSRDRADRTLLRIVRLREVGDTLGEPMPLFEAPVEAARDPSRVAEDSTGLPAPADQLFESPRLAFGPDGLLYALLPSGLEFDNEPAASSPHASMLRVTDEGLAPRIGPLSGIIAHPLGFAWHPSTAALWLIFPGAGGETLVRPSGAVSSVSGINGIERGVIRMTEGATPLSEVLVLQQAGALDLARTHLQGIELESIGVLRLVMPVLAESVLGGVTGRITDMAPAGGGAVYVSTSDGDGRHNGDAVVLRLTPRPR